MKTLHMAFTLSKILIGGIFIYTGIIHIADPEGFTRAVSAYELLPAWSVGMFARVIPWVELAAGLSVATGIFIRAGSLVTSLLLVSFTAALALSLYRGLDIPCGCFTTSPESGAISAADLVRDLALLAASSFVFLTSSVKSSFSIRISGWHRYAAPAVSLVLVSALLLYHGLTKNPCDKVSLESINRHKPFASAAILSKRPANGLCEVLLQAGNRKTAVYVGGSYLITGEMFQDESNITSAGFMLLVSKQFLALRGELDTAVALQYSPEGEVRHTLYMFASPDCPHCEEALQEIRPALDEMQIELKVLFMEGRGSEGLIRNVLCTRMGLDPYLSGDWRDAEYDLGSSDCNESIETLRRARELGAKLGISQVPTFFLENGIMLTGEKMPAIREMLKE